MDLDQLEKILARAKPKFLYTIPTYHNPASLTLSPGRRERLAGLAREMDFLILADEVYRFLGYEQEPPRPMGDFSAEVEQVISINSFSKIFAPGLRLGWIQAHPRVIKNLAGCGMLDSGGGFNPFTSAVADQMIRSGDLSANINEVKKVYHQRLQVMDRALAQHLPQAVYLRPQGGYYFWVQLPGLDTGKLRKQVRKAGIDFRPGSLFSGRKGLKDYLRLSFSYCTEDEITRGIAKLGELLSG
jgi:DNA-binding transcriptional MocR family regulator